MIRSFLDLEVYQESLQLSIEVESIIKTFPQFEQYLLCYQSRRASRAVPALIAEGYAKRETIAVFRKFTRDAIGESNEMINHLAFAKIIGGINLISNLQFQSLHSNIKPLTSNTLLT